MKRSSIRLDFTPLLDVILILLFLILVSQIQETKKAEQNYKREEARLKSENSDLMEYVRRQKERNDLSDSDEAKWKLFREKTSSLVLTFRRDGEKTTATLHMENGLRLQKPENEDLHNWLQKSLDLQKKEIRILAFAYNGDVLLWKDYRDIQSELLRLAGEHGNLFIEEVKEHSGKDGTQYGK